MTKQQSIEMPENFPVQYSTLSAKALKKEIEKVYGWQKVKCKFHLHGVSDTYIIESSNGKNIFKIYRESHRTLEQIQGEIELLLILRSKGRNVAYPVKDSTGHYLQEFNAPESLRYGVMFSYAPGKNIFELTDEQYRIVGKELGAIHNITSSINLKYQRDEYNFETMVDSPLKTIKPAFKQFPEGYKYLKKTSEEFVKKIKSLDPSKFSLGICHYDYHAKNIHLDENNTPTIFDFDFAGRGWLVNDIAVFHSHFIWTKNFQENEEISMEEFLNGYKESRSLSEEEKKAVPYLGFISLLFYLEFQFNNYDDWSNFFFGERFLRHRIKEMQDYESKYCK